MPSLATLAFGDMKMSRTTIMTAVRLPERQVAQLAEMQDLLGLSKTDVIIRAIDAFCDPDRHADRVVDADLHRQRDSLLCELGRLGSQQRNLGGLLALAVKRDGGVDIPALEKDRAQLRQVADQIAAVATKILETVS